MTLLTTNSKTESRASTLDPGSENPSTRPDHPAFRLDLRRSLSMHPVLASSIAALSFVVFLLCGMTMKPMYEAEALIHVQPEPTTLLGEAVKPAFDSGKYDSFLQEQIQTMQRPDTVAAALERLPHSSWVEYGATKETAAEQIVAKLKIARVTTSYQVSLMLKGSDPRNVTDVVNAITYAYLDLAQSEARVENQEGARLLAEEHQRVANELRKDQEEQNGLAVNLGIANPDGESDPYEGELTALREQLAQARTSHEAALARLNSLNGQPQGQHSALAAEADEATLADPELSAFKSTISERRATLRGQMSGMTPDNPLRRRNQEELAELDRSLEEMTTKLRSRNVRNLQEKLRADLEQTGDLEASISSHLIRRTANATRSTPKLQRAAELNEDVKRLLLRQIEIENAIRSLQLEGNRSGAARLTLAAKVPTSQEGNRKRLLFLASFPLALVLGAAAASIARKFDPRIYTGRDLEDVLKFLPLATLPAHDEVSGALVAEHMLRLAGAVTSAHRTKGSCSFLFAAVSGSTDIQPLSRMLIEKLRYTGINACSVLTADLLLPIDPENKSGTEYIRSARMSGSSSAQTGQGFVELNLALLQAHHSLVLVEATQPFECAQTEYIARCIDATILVVESAVSTKAELIRASKSVHRLHVPGIGFVLQEVRRRYLTDSTPLLKRCETVASSPPEIKTAPPAQPNRDQADQKSDAMDASPGSASWTGGQPTLRNAMPLAVKAESVEDTLVLCQDSPQSEQLISPSDDTVPRNQIALGLTSTSDSSDLIEESRPKPVAHRKSNTTPASAVREATVQTETANAGPEGDFFETEQQFEYGSGLADTKNVGVDDARLRSDVNHLGLLRGCSNQSIEDLPEHDQSRYSRPSKLSQPSINRVGERRSDKLLASLREGPQQPTPAVRFAQSEFQNDSDQPSAVLLYRREDPISTTQHEDPAGREDLLSRQWNLLSRFQQKRSF